MSESLSHFLVPSKKQKWLGDFIIETSVTTSGTSEDMTQRQPEVSQQER